MFVKFNLTGQRFGRLIAREPVRQTNRKGIWWKCQCSCGNIHFTTTNALKSGAVQSCGCFRKERLLAANRTPYENVKKYFEDHGCELLSNEYFKNTGKLSYRCECGNVAKISYSNFRIGQRCKQCGIRKSSRKGPQNHSWKENKTDEERLFERKFGDYAEWRQKVFGLQKTCLVCGTTHWLQAHHLYSWADYPELRLDPNNGALLCKPCHDEFHKVFGKGRNTPEQLEEFKVIKIQNGEMPILKHGYIKKKSDVILNFNNEAHSVTEWALILGISRYVIYQRLSMPGWDVEKTLTTPVRPRKPNGMVGKEGKHG